MINRSRSSGDGRRRYVHLERLGARRLAARSAPRTRRGRCSCAPATRPAASSPPRCGVQLTSLPAESAGTHPADRVHPGAVAAARRAKLPLAASEPRSIDEVVDMPPLVITVCDQAHEELDPPDTWLHWSIPDPVAIGSPTAFDATVRELRQRIDGLVEPGQA